MISSTLLNGLEIVLVVSVMSVLVTPLLCWVLPDRINSVREDGVA